MSAAVHVTGLGVWTPGFDDLGRWRAGEPDPGVARPRSELFAGAAARRATALTHLVAHVLGRACAEGGRAPADVALVLASAGGELDATFACLRLLLETPAASSPLRFAGSLHSSPLGHVSVALGARGLGTAVAAPPSSLVAMGLLEATALVRAEGVPTVLVVADDTWPHAPCPPVAVGVLLEADAGPSTRGWLGVVSRGAPTLPTAGRGGALRASPAAGALDLLDALLDGREGVIGLSDGAPGWVVPWTPRP